MPGNEPGKPAEGSSFHADWLTLREPVDHRSRAAELLGPLERTWRRGGWRRIVDLGAGAGSNLRYMAGRMVGPQEWVLVDHDDALLELATHPRPDVTVTRVVGDLAREGLEEIARADLVLGAALLDLTSERWLRLVVEACAEGHRGILFTTVYDGTVAWERAGGRGSTRPDDARDGKVRDLVNAHQRRDKGLGGALGPDAAPVAHRLFRDAGFDTWLVPAPWILDAGDALLTERLLDGWVQAAREQSDQVDAWIDAWRRDRMDEIRSGRTRVIVGHLDLLALPSGA